MPKKHVSWSDQSNAIDCSAPISSVPADEELNLQSNDSKSDEVVVQKESTAEVILDDCNKVRYGKDYIVSLVFKI